MLRLLRALGILGCAAAGIIGCAVAGEAAPPGDDDQAAGRPDASSGTGVTFVGSPDAAEAVDAGRADAPPCMGGQAWDVDPATGACYMLFSIPTIWPEAKGICETMTPRAHLVTISSPAEADVVASLAGGGEPWIGLNDVIVEGTYGWVTGEPFGLTDWLSGEPNNTGDCVRLVDGRWADLHCQEVRGYICERF